MITADQVTAVIPTRGDVDLAPILAEFPAFGEVLVYDNSQRENLYTFGRHALCAEASFDVVFTLDDDHRFWGFDHLLAEYEPGVMVANMDEAWARRRDYLDMAMFGRGAVYDRDLPATHLARYLAEWPADEFFLLYCDVILGVLAPTRRVDVGCFEELPQGYAPNRMNALPDFEAGKALAKERARAIRDGVAA